MLNIKTSLRSSVFAGAFVMALAASAAQAAPVQFNFRYVNTVSTVTGSFMSDLFAPGQYALSSISGTVNSTIDGNGSITNLNYYIGGANNIFYFDGLTASWDISGLGFDTTNTSPVNLYAGGGSPSGFDVIDLTGALGDYQGTFSAAPAAPAPLAGGGMLASLAAAIALLVTRGRGFLGGLPGFRKLGTA